MPYGKNVVMIDLKVVINVVIPDRVIKPLIGSPKEFVILFVDIALNKRFNHRCGLLRG